MLRSKTLNCIQQNPAKKSWYYCAVFPNRPVSTNISTGAVNPLDGPQACVEPHWIQKF